MTTATDIDELERLLAAATGSGVWSLRRVMDKTFRVRTEAGTFVASGTHEQDASLIVTLHNSAPAMIAELRELRAENARLREALDEDGLAEIITDTLDIDWQPRWAAQAIRRAALGEPQ